LKRVEILGVGLDRVSLEEALDELAGWCRRGDRYRYIVTPNPEIIMRAAGDRRLARALADADLSVADGVGVVWASGRLGTPLPGRASGADLAEGLLRSAAREGYGVYLLGARPEAVREAAGRVRRRYGASVLAGFHHGYFDVADDGDVVAGINASGARALLVGMGSPRQEVWMWSRRGRLGPCVAVGVGGAIDVLAGRVSRAPAWVRGAGLEWVYRTLREPRRIRRTAALPRFVAAVLRESRARRAGGADAQRGGTSASGGRQAEEDG